MAKFPIRYFRSLRMVCLLVVFLSAVPAPRSQGLGEPQREQLLNGLNVLLWPAPGSSSVLIKLRIHSGSAFDLAGRSGEMSLLGDILFPDAATVDYFTEEMGGKLEVRVNYDSTTITMQGKASEFDKIVEVLRNGVLSTQLTPEVVDRVRQARIKILRETAVSPPVVADRAIAVRLFGDFPYGKPSEGSAEDVARIDRADLMLARDRFLNSNNATLGIVGGINPSHAMRILRQLLGPWRKSDQLVPTTFRQPQPPDPRVLIINSPSQTAEVRLAVRGLSRSDTDAVAADVLAKVAYRRWMESLPVLSRKPAFVRNDTHVLPGMFIFGAGVEETNVLDVITTARKVFESLIGIPPSAAELERAKNEVIAERSTGTKPEGAVDGWLDQETYKLKSVPDAMTVMQVSAADVQRAATRLFKEAKTASIITGDPVHLRAVLENRIPYEILGAIDTSSAPSKIPAKPAGTPNPR
ncbi:MAG: hypothetical protein C5B55_05520 [Blastocatellia bacterium]|nr:MAG: hypothetical protein C5B55_05520 [Blastocatellia bacterium]